ncbi:Ubiquinol-cytochrome C reductase, cytochrome C1 subunit [hydrothermal vent metagenome]|uniref:Ubiquinol-cytochrome C reductase, cytochrome C1 subunit n=1 Tax=hydrothermal vent metagenome TaxID=652676 RepID=A0A3B0RTP7_9ZZZZ
MLKWFTSLLVMTLFVSGAAMASGGGEGKIKKEHWHFDGVFGTYDRAAAQRGFQVYQEVCAACHSAKYVAFYNLADKGAPFYDPEFPNSNENPVVKAIAKMFTVTDGPDDSGDMFERPGITADKLPSPFANDMAAKASNGGALPPDLSLITRARADGSNYVYSLLTGYEEAPHGVDIAAGMSYNPVFYGGNQIAMAPPLFEGSVEYTDGTEASVEQMAKDVTEFLTWAADPKMEQRKQTGWMVMLYLLVLAILLYGSYRAVWRNVKH